MYDQAAVNFFSGNTAVAITTISPQPHIAAAITIHPFCHLYAIGQLQDVGPEPYGWTNNVKWQNVDNADLLALLALVIELVDKKYGVDKSGRVTAPVEGG
ncbi:Uncharacterized protein TPAR_08204 [Tolypocladium paradoxum]|uniref:Uncharacterized protein n=1 Tax=Tolypocladium paradoxum TaxID=94208 RepID=A0A2S4KN39_9HYPO|nr:Uncharacterized protein TPAR_08204 [Tolypocladium paradoxum]